MTWIMAALSILGSILNVKKMWFGFVLWSITNVFWVVHNVLINENAQAAQFLVYLGLSLWGLYAWTRKVGRTERQDTSVDDG